MSETVDAAGRRLRARIGGLALASQRDPMEYTRAARTAFLARFEHEVDPNGELPEAERTRRAEAARKAYFSKLALRRIMRKAKPQETAK